MHKNIEHAKSCRIQEVSINNQSNNIQRLKKIKKTKIKNSPPPPNRLCLSQLIKKLNSTERGALFRHFCVSKVITTAHAHKSGVIFHFFPRAFKQKKIKALRPKMTKIASRGPVKAGPLCLSFWSFLTFLHHSIEKVERHLLWKLCKKFRRKSWSFVPPKLPACIGFLYKVVYKIGRLRKFNRSREIEFNFFTAWTISMKFGTPVQHTPGYKTCLRFFNFCLGT